MDEPLRFFEDKEHAEDYVKYRLVFPDTVVERIVTYVKDGGCQLNLALDVGCGTGHHSTMPLARVFNNVIGVDVSQEQINQAPRDLDNATFHVGQGEDLNFVKDSSVDLVSVATAIHWLNLPVFYKEVDRILKTGGCLAVYWQKGLPAQNESVEKIIEEFYASTSEFCHESVRKLYDRDEYPECPYGEWHDQTMFFSKSWRVEEFVKRVATDSYCRMYMKTYPQSTALHDFEHRLTAVCGNKSDEPTTSPMIEIPYKLPILLCRKL